MTKTGQFLCLVALLATAPAVSQNGTWGLEEMTVTAQKRPERLREVPISISVITMEELLNLNLYNFEELEEQTPGVSISPGIQSAAIRLRGVGPAGFAVNAPQSVAVFVDEVVQSQVGAVFGTLVDVQRVEVLRGPQGTLYGQNAPGGVYNITTRKPDLRRTGGYVRAGYGTYDFDADRATRDLRAAANLPLVQDSLALRVAGVLHNADGYVTTENPAVNNKATGGRKSESLRSHLLWRPASDLQLRWTLNYHDLTNHPARTNFEGQVPRTGGTSEIPATRTRFDAREYWGDYESEVEADVRDTSAHLTWQLPVTQLDVIAAYQDFDTSAVENRQPFPGGVSNFAVDLNYEVTTLELRTTGNEEWFDYVAGLYYYERPVETDLLLTIGNADLLADGGEEHATYSAFANVNTHLSHAWHLALGLRYDENEVDIGINTLYAGVFDARLEDKESYDHLSWSVKLRRLIGDNATAYLAVDNAFKQGGYNPRVSAGVGLAELFPEVAGIAADHVRFEEETSTAYELGLKGASENRRLQYAVALFYQEFDDHQLSRGRPAAAVGPFGDLFSGVITNADSVTTRGVEFDVAYQFTQRWRLLNRTAWFDARLQNWSTRFCAAGEGTTPAQLYCPGDEEALNNQPQWQVNTQLAYRRAVRDWVLYSRLNWSWLSKVAETGITDDYQDAKSRIGMSIGARSKRLGLEVRLWGKNLTDEDLNQNPGLQRNGDNTQPDAFRGRYTRGREVGITLGYRF
ncbi:MAG: TonB-dependent receptor [Halioglobus sp.]|nr:TonB-dependent receptor [Halioglobus sp.]